MLTAKKIGKYYGSLAVFSDISFSLEGGQKVALVGTNGTGKTTLLKCIAGLEELDEGSLEVAKGTCIGYLPQDTSLFGDESISEYLRRISGIASLEQEMETLESQLDDPRKSQKYNQIQEQYERLGGYSFAHKVEILISGFGLVHIGLHHKLSDLSSGQKSKVALAGILLKGIDLLLLDEPTNNLDLPALIWLEDYLKDSNVACIIVSHDRYFLDKIVRKIFEIDWHTKTLQVSNGTYSAYLEAISKQLQTNKESYRIQQAEIDRLKSSAQQKRVGAENGSKFVGRDNDKFARGAKRDRAGKSSKIAKTIEKRIEQMEKVERPFERKPFEIVINPSESSRSLNIVLEDMIAGYPNNFRIGPISLNIDYGDRIGIMGFNGSGKSTLSKTVTGVIVPLNGKVEIGSGIKIGNLMQEHENLPRDMSLFEFLKSKTYMREQDVYAKLSKSGFSERQMKNSIGTLSPGGRARLLLALFSVLSVNVLILDEPTNHLDIEALEALEEAVGSYKGTLIVISHDRYFLEKSNLNSVYVLEGGILSKITSYRDYISSAEKKAEQLIQLL